MTRADFIGIEIRPSKYVWRDHLVKFIGKMKKNRKVLDVACNRLMHAHLFPDFEYTGLDINQQLLDIGKKKHPEKNFKAVRGDMRKLPFKNSSFDYVVSNHSLSNLDNDKDRMIALKEFARVLRKEGSMFVQIPIYHGFEKDMETFLAGTFRKVVKKKYRGSMSQIFEGFLGGYDRGKAKRGIVALSGKKASRMPKFLKLFFPIASFTAYLGSYFDGLGKKSEISYICYRKK